MLLPILIGSTLFASTYIRTSVLAEDGSYARVSINQHINATSSRTISQTTTQTIRTNGEVKQTIVENRCERVTDRVNNHTRAGENVKDRRARIHQGVVRRLGALFSKLEEQSCDTSAAKANLATWETMISQYRDLFNAWLDSLHALQNQVCQKNPPDYRTALQAVHDKRKVAQDKKREVSQFYQNTLKPSVKDLRTTCKI